MFLDGLSDVVLDGGRDVGNALFGDEVLNEPGEDAAEDHQTDDRRGQHDGYGAEDFSEAESILAFFFLFILFIDFVVIIVAGVVVIIFVIVIIVIIIIFIDAVFIRWVWISAAAAIYIFFIAKIIVIIRKHFFFFFFRAKN